VRCIRGTRSERTLTATRTAGPLVDDRCRRAVSIDWRPTTAYCTPHHRGVRVEAGRRLQGFFPERGGRGALRAPACPCARRRRRPGAACVRADLMPRKRAPGAQAYRRAASGTTRWTATARARASRQADSARGAEPEQARTGPAMHASAPTAATSPRARPQPRTYAGE
jgi:hypothetical protein